MTPLRLLHLTDLHLSGDEAAVLRGIQPLASLRRTLAQAKAYSQASGWVPDAVVVSSAFPETAEVIRGLGYRVVTVDVSELHKAESGVTCMSLVFADHVT